MISREHRARRHGIARELGCERRPHCRVVQHRCREGAPQRAGVDQAGPDRAFAYDHDQLRQARSGRLSRRCRNGVQRSSSASVKKRTLPRRSSGTASRPSLIPVSPISLTHPQGGLSLWRCSCRWNMESSPPEAHGCWRRLVEKRRSPGIAARQHQSCGGTRQCGRCLGRRPCTLQHCFGAEPLGQTPHRRSRLGGCAAAARASVTRDAPKAGYPGRGLRRVDIPCMKLRASAGIALWSTFAKTGVSADTKSLCGQAGMHPPGARGPAGRRTSAYNLRTSFAKAKQLRHRLHWGPRPGSRLPAS